MIDHKSPKHSSPHTQNLRCVILAAGSSTRLRPLTDSRPKCLLKVHEKALIERTIENVLESGVKEIAVVIGYWAEIIRDFIRQRFPHERIRFILNHNFATTNNALSLLLAKRFLGDKDGSLNQGLLLLDGDILFSSKLLPFLLSSEMKDRIAVRVVGEHNEEEVRVNVDSQNNVLVIGKEVPLSETYGESLGIEIFSAETTARLFKILEERMHHGVGKTEYYETAFQKMIDQGVKLKAIDVSVFPAIEIDTLEDLERAERMNIF
jgi:choline kinase